MLGQALQFIADPHNKFGQELLITLEMCAIPIVLSLLIAIPLGIAVAQQPVAAFLATNTSGLARASEIFASFGRGVPA